MISRIRKKFCTKSEEVGLLEDRLKLQKGDASRWEIKLRKNSLLER